MVASGKITGHHYPLYLYIYIYAEMQGVAFEQIKSFPPKQHFHLFAFCLSTLPIFQLIGKIGSSDEMNESENKGEMTMRREKNKNNIGIIFRFADRTDILLMVLGTVGAIGDGMSTNCLLVFASRIMNSLGFGQTQSQQNHHENFLDEVEKVSQRLLSSQQNTLSFSFLFLFQIFLRLTVSLTQYMFPFFQSSLTVQLVFCVLGISSDGGGFLG